MPGKEIEGCRCVLRWGRAWAIRPMSPAKFSDSCLQSLQRLMLFGIMILRQLALLSRRSRSLYTWFECQRQRRDLSRLSRRIRKNYVFGQK